MAWRGLVNFWRRLVDEQRMALIFLHGSGDTGEGIQVRLGALVPGLRQAWLEYVTAGAFESELQQEGVTVHFPTAPLVPYSRPTRVGAGVSQRGAFRVPSLWHGTGHVSC